MSYRPIKAHKIVDSEATLNAFAWHRNKFPPLKYSQEKRPENPCFRRQSHDQQGKAELIASYTQHWSSPRGFPLLGVFASLVL